MLFMARNWKPVMARPARIDKVARNQGFEPVREHRHLRVGQAFGDGIARLIDRMRESGPPKATSIAPPGLKSFEGDIRGL